MICLCIVNIASGVSLSTFLFWSLGISAYVHFIDWASFTFPLVASACKRWSLGIIRIFPGHVNILCSETLIDTIKNFNTQFPVFPHNPILSTIRVASWILWLLFVQDPACSNKEEQILGLPCQIKIWSQTILSDTSSSAPVFLMVITPTWYFPTHSVKATLPDWACLLPQSKRFEESEGRELQSSQSEKSQFLPQTVLWEPCATSCVSCWLAQSAVIKWCKSYKCIKYWYLSYPIPKNYTPIYSVHWIWMVLLQEFSGTKKKTAQAIIVPY